MIDKLSKQFITELLNNKNAEITVLETVDSTNAYLKRIITDDLPEGSVIIADSQTAGRGRFSRKFFSPENCGIYMSIFLKPKLQAEKAVLITAAAAVAVCKAIEKLGESKTEIKWVNDVYIGSKKVCGILTEGSLNSNGSFNYAILGIGINAYIPENSFDAEIKDIAGAVFKEKKENLRNRLAAEVINCFMDYYNNLENKTFLEDYRKRNLVLGKEITVPKGNTVLAAKALKIDENCRLLVEYNDSKREYLSSGEISIGVDFNNG